jgi:ADP-ribose pyrophosphatase YjhB (NUDIX family)
MVKIRRRGTAIIETKKGILVVALEKKNLGFMLPGGGAEWWETRKMAAKREVKEEIGLKVTKAKYLFKFLGPEFKTKAGISQRNYAKVFLVETEGKPKPSNEIKYISYWKPGSKLKLMAGAKMALDIYLKNFKR